MFVDLQESIVHIMSAHLIKSASARVFKGCSIFFLPEIIRSLFFINDFEEG